MKLFFYNLSKDQTNIIKGVAMICLVLHNFLHWTNYIGENEMSFNADRIYVLFDAISSNKTMLFNGLFSYFGFYFLQLFIFISGYGLAKQYAKNITVSYSKYIAPRLIKLYALLLFGIAIYFVLFYKHFDLRWFVSFAGSSLLMYNNLSFDRIFMYVGPWWYFSLALQLYLLFPLLYKVLDRYKEKGLFVLILFSYILIFLFNPIAMRLHIPIFGNFLGHLPEFLLGIGFAIFPRIHLNWKIVIPTLIIFILSNFFDYFFSFTFLAFTILFLAFVCPAIKLLPAGIIKAFIFLGSISMFMFLINGPLRVYTMPYLTKGGSLHILLGSFIHLIIVIIVSYIMSLIYNRFIDPLTIKLIRRIKKLTPV